MGVIKPAFKLRINSKEIKNKYIKSLVYVDEIDNKTDSVQVETTKEFERPRFGDELELWLGENEESLVYMGMFHIQSTTITNQKLNFKATGANFTNALKTKKNRTWEKSTLCDIVTKIADEHNLKNRCTIERSVHHEAQSHESDLAFLKRLAKEVHATFAIKNSTIIFLNKDAFDAPIYNCDIANAKSSSIELTNRSKYKSAQVQYRDTTKNKDRSMTVGSGEPKLELKGSFATQVAAKSFAESKMKENAKGTIRGNVSVVFDIDPVAGGKVKIVGSRYDDGEYSIKRVTHSLPSGVTRVEFEG